MQSRNGAIARRTPEGRGNGKKATKAEKEQRIQRAMMLIVQGCPKSEIKKAFRDAWGLGWYQIERYISYAREAGGRDWLDGRVHFGRHETPTLRDGNTDRT